ncbi:MAG TPA: hypothetical protein VM141_07640 [Planctomycetota bacterium]|nr:hypothetical protein [Planctomycetota bacterium]
MVSYRGKWMRTDDLVTLIPSHKFDRTVALLNHDGKQRSFRIASFDTRLKFIKGKVRCIVAVGSWTSAMRPACTSF